MAARRSPLEIAQQHEKKGNLTKAAEAYSEYLSKNGTDARALLRLAEIQERLGSAPSAAEAFHRLGVLHANDGIEGKATAAFRRALRLMPTHVQSVELLADVLANAGKKRDALDVLETGSRALEASGDVRGRLKMLQRAAELDEGLTSRLAFAEGLAVTGRKADAIKLLRLSADRLDQQDASLDRLQVLERLLRITSGEPKVALEAANAAVALRDYRRALVSLRIALESAPEYVDLISLTATVLEAMGEEARALLVFREAARRFGREGRNAEAKKSWISVLRLSPEDAEAHSAMGTEPAPQARISAQKLGPLAGIGVSEMASALSALSEQTAQGQVSPIADHEFEVSLEDLDEELVIEKDSTRSDS